MRLAGAMQPFMTIKQGKMGLRLGLCRQALFDQGGDDKNQ
jgi:hypothetical protein